MGRRYSSFGIGLFMLAVLASCAPQPANPNHTEYRAVSAGGSHTCALTRADDAFCWGNNATGQLGDGSMASSSKPVLVSGNLKFTKIAAGSNHTCGISQGAVYCWGMNLNGQIGNGASPNAPPVQTPTKVAGPQQSFTEVAAGGNFSCAIATGGAAFCWGQTGNGKLGLGSGLPIGRFGDPALPNESVNTPSPVAGGQTFKQIAAQGDNACALSTSNQVFCWGSNLFKQIGAATTDTCQIGVQPAWPCAMGPVQVTAATGSVPTGVAVGDQFSCYSDDHYDLYCWGGNADAAVAAKTTGLPICQFPNGMSFECAAQPTKAVRPVAAGATLAFVRVDAGSNWLCSSVYPVGNSVVCWGRNSNGQLGDGLTADRGTSATLATALGALDLSSGGSHACLVTDGSNAYRVYCWGSNLSGQLGAGTTTTRETTPQLVIER